MRARSNAEKHLRRQADYAKAKLDEWAKRFATDPTYALEWSDSTFTEAARLKVYDLVADALAALPDNPNNSREKIVEYIRNEVLRGARSPASSTSVPSNVMETRTTAAWAEALEIMGER